MSHERLADTKATIATYTVDRLAFSLSPPVVAAVVDFDDGGRFRCEMTDVDPEQVAIGNRVEMSFRRISTVAGVHNYLWKARPLKLDYKPVTRLENMCATGSEAFRNASYAVASGAVDMAMAIGVEKLKDSGFSGLVVSRPQDDGTAAELTAPALFSLLAPAYS